MSKVLYSTEWITLFSGDNDILYVDLGQGVMAVPITEEGRVIMITEYSTAFRERVMFLPAGGVEAGESAVEALNRELQEEAGFKAGRFDPLGVVRPHCKYAASEIQLYLARDLQSSRLAGNEPYVIEVETIFLADFETLIESGRLSDSNVIAALYMARSFLEREARPR